MSYPRPVPVSRPGRSPIATALAVVVVGVGLTACAGRGTERAPPGNTGGEPGGGGTIALSTPDQAIDRFVAAWAADIRPHLAGHKDPLIGEIDRTMREPDARRRYQARRESCRDATRDIEELIARTGYDFVLYGSMADAHRHDRCWTVLYICCMKGDAGAVLDPDTGALLVVWRIPEG